MNTPDESTEPLRPAGPTPSSPPAPPAPPTPLTPLTPPAPGSAQSPRQAAEDPAPGRDGDSAPAGGCGVPAARTTRTGPRTGPIVWGALILAFCGYTAQRAFGAGDLDTAWWITATVIGLGALLLIVGTTILLRSRRHEAGPRGTGGSRPGRTG